MDLRDAAILREMLRERALLWGGGDPRIRMTDFAERIGVDRTTVWARLKAWKTEGFLVRHEVVPNPCLFGAGVATGDIRVDDPRAKPGVVDALADVDGVLAGAEQVGPFILLLYAHESPATLARCTRLIARLPGVDATGVCIPFEPPRSTLTLTATDWRILAALREFPEGPMKRVAEAAAVSTRTLTRRYGELLAANAVWWFPVLDFTRYRGAVLARFVVALSKPDAAAPLVNAVRHAFPESVWWATAMESDGSAWAEFHCHLDAAAGVEALETWLLDAPGVAAVDTYFPKSWFVLPAWFDERIARALESAGTRGT